MSIDPITLAVTAALNAASMAMTASQVIEGPRLDSLGVTTSDYGQPLNYAYGTKRLFGVPCVWAEALTEVKQQNKTKGGKYNEYKYFGTWALMIADHEIQGVTRIWFDKHLIYDVSGAGPISPLGLDGGVQNYMRIYLGTADQDPDPRIQATIDALHGPDSTPAYRGRAYVVFEEVPLEKLGNRLPQVDVEVVAIADPAYPYEAFPATVALPFPTTFGATPDGGRFIWIDGQNYEIWDVASRAPMITGVLDDSEGSILTQNIMGVASNGKFYVLTDAGAGLRNIVEYPADGIGLPTVRAAGLDSAYKLQVVSTDAGDFICASTFLTANGGWIIPRVAGVAEYIDPTAYLGVDTSIRTYFADLDGALWCVCNGSPGLATNELGFIRLTGVRVGYIVTMPSTAGFLARVNCWHYRDAEIDVFVTVRGSITSGDAWAHVDVATMTVTAQAGLEQWSDDPAIVNVRPGTRYFYHATGRIDVKTLTTDQTWLLDDWDAGTSPGRNVSVYDPLNHAIFGSDPDNDGVIWFYLDRVSGQAVTLRSIVEDVAERAGLVVASEIDATAMDQEVAGYSWVQGQGKAILEPLLEFFNSEVRPHDFKLQFVKRGAASGGTIETAQMGAGVGAADTPRYAVTRTLDTDLPRGVNVNFADPAMDQQPNSARTQRYADATDGRREQSLDVTTLVSDIDAARSAADGYLRRAWFSNEAYSTGLSRQQMALEPGDVRVLVFDDITKVGKLTRLEIGANGVLSATFVRDGTAAHVDPAPQTQHEAQDQPGAPADGYVPPVILTPAFSRGHAMDIPLAQDSHEGLVLYLAAGPYSNEVAWAGAEIYESPDDGETFSRIQGVTAAQKSVWGLATTVLPDALADVWDMASVLNVQIHSGELASVTQAQAEAGANLALIGDELVQFTTAALQGDGSYDLSGFLRGRRGSEQHIATHAVGDRFVMLSPTLRHVQGVSDIGDDFVYRTVSAGNINLTGFDEALTYSGASLKPYSPAHLEVEDDAGDLVATWVRRTRLGGFNVNGTTPPLGESAEAYEVDVVDGGGAVLRTYDGLTTPAATYSAADQASDGGAGAALRVYQISSSVGRGFPAEIAI